MLPPVFRAGLLLACIALVLGACDDDNDDNGDDPTATAVPITATPDASPTAPADAAITIDEPPDGAIVTSPVTMSGTANVFEAALTIDALGNAAGLVLCQRRIMATSGTGTPGTWESVLAFAPPPSDGPITLRAYSFSPRDGAMENLVERSVIASAERPDIIITSPACAEEVSGASMTVEGMAQVFEAALTVEIRDASGAVLLTQNVLAASGVELSPWSATFDISGLTPAFYDVVAYSESAEDGSVINVFPVQISRVP